MDIIIIGSGPAGLTAAIYMARAGLNPLVVVGKNGIGGQLMITSEIENFPGCIDITGSDLTEIMYEQAKQFGANFIEEDVYEIKKNCDNNYCLKIGDKWIESYSIIISTGARAKWLNLPDEEKFMNRGISACATCDGPLPIFKNKIIAVNGGGDSACEEALFLTRFASKVILIHRRDKLRASQIMINRVMNNEKIEILWDTVIEGYIGNENSSHCEPDSKGINFLSKIKLLNVKTNIRSEIEIGGLFIAIGHTPNTTFLKGFLDLDENGYILTTNSIFTNLEGIFAAGDCHDKKYRQAITAAGFGCMAALEAEKYIEYKLSL